MKKLLKLKPVVLSLNNIEIPTEIPENFSLTLNEIPEEHMKPELEYEVVGLSFQYEIPESALF